MKLNQQKDEIILRIKHVRKNILKMPAQKLAEIAGINVNSIRNWERGKIDFLTSISMNNIIKVFESAGIYASEEWLRTGEGVNPCWYSDIKDVTILGFEEENLFRSIKRKMGQDVIVVSMLDESMAPMAHAGDRIGGVINKNNLEQNHNLNCIIKYDNEKIIVRKLQVQSDIFSLHSLSDYDIIYPKEINWIAPVCRRWIY
ncbi:helix-turn-helix transcriptional regulator [Fluviispira multicolorata]|uniref:HTH cro/C1-type domain-containing protein n=1 Tax=Fluviispira multicolorata TaxID=2654512 RepID=A0A833N3R4_9BACT|nr:helix-turn-helix transcriptional regulator [Fluviispira multicolorata]KAB8029122.1 hypothetical protein GCL57_11325 [Fluviispira multicolorata]